MTAATIPWHVRALDCFVATIVITCMIHGARIGLFRSTVACLMAITLFVVPLALWSPLAWWCTRMDVPPWIAYSLTYMLLCIATAAAARKLTAFMIPSHSMWLPLVADIVGGSFVGFARGVATAGSVLVAISILPGTAWLWTDPAGARFDAGRAMLTAFARCATVDGDGAAFLLLGEPRVDAAGDTSLASETFVDHNRNGERDDDEAYLDADGNKSFTARVPYRDTDADGRRYIGLLERYRLGCWELVTVLPATADAPPAAAKP